MSTLLDIYSTKRKCLKYCYQGNKFSNSWEDVGRKCGDKMEENLFALNSWSKTKAINIGDEGEKPLNLYLEEKKINIAIILYSKLL